MNCFLFVTFASLLSTTLPESQLNSYKVAFTVGAKDVALPFRWNATSDIVIGDGKRTIYSQAAKQLAEGFDVIIDYYGDYVLVIKDVSLQHAGMYMMESVDGGTIRGPTRIVVNVVDELKCETLVEEGLELDVCSARFAGPDIPHVRFVKNGGERGKRCAAEIHNNEAVSGPKPVKRLYCRMPNGYRGCELSFNQTTFQPQVCLLKHDGRHEQETSTKPTQSEIRQTEILELLKSFSESRSIQLGILSLLIYLVVRKLWKCLRRILVKRREAARNAQPTDNPTTPREANYEMLPTAEALAKIADLSVQVEDS